MQQRKGRKPTVKTMQTEFNDREAIIKDLQMAVVNTNHLLVTVQKLEGELQQLNANVAAMSAFMEAKGITEAEFDTWVGEEMVRRQAAMEAEKAKGKAPQSSNIITEVR